MTGGPARGPEVEAHAEAPAVENEVIDRRPADVEVALDLRPRQVVPERGLGPAIARRDDTIDRGMRDGQGRHGRIGIGPGLAALTLGAQAKSGETRFPLDFVEPDSLSKPARVWRRSRYKTVQSPALVT